MSKSIKRYLGEIKDGQETLKEYTVVLAGNGRPIKLTKIPYKKHLTLKMYDGSRMIADKEWQKLIYIDEYILKELRKYTSNQLCDILEDHIDLSNAVMAILEERHKTSSKQNDKKVYDCLEYIIGTTLIEAILERAETNNKLFALCYIIADQATRFLMKYAYEQPTEKLCSMANLSTEAPFNIFFRDSAKEIKRKFEEISKRIGLAKKYNPIKPKFYSVPGKYVLNYYFVTMQISRRNFLTMKNFNEFWKKAKLDFINDFRILEKEEPKYYCTLRDDRGDKTPLYIKRKLWLQACKQALKGIANANTEQAIAVAGIPGPE